jgi:hypothetical protein
MPYRVAFPTAVAIRKVHMGHVFGVRGPALDKRMAQIHRWGGWLVLALTLMMLVSRWRMGAARYGLKGWIASGDVQRRRNGNAQ